MDVHTKVPIWFSRKDTGHERLWRTNPRSSYKPFAFAGYMEEIKEIADKVLTPHDPMFSTEELRSMNYGTRNLPTPNPVPDAPRRPPMSVLKLNLPPNSTASSFYPQPDYPTTQYVPYLQPNGDDTRTPRVEKYLVGFIFFLGTLVLTLLTLLLLTLTGVVKGRA